MNSQFIVTLDRTSKCLILCCAVFGTQLLSAANATAPASSSTYYQEGIDALSDEKTQDAEAFFRKALAAAQAQSPTSAEVEKCLLKLADVLTLRDKTQEAEQLYRKLLAITVRKYGNNSPKIVPALMALGSIQESEGNHTAAMGFYTQALRINEKGYGPYSPGIASSIHRLGGNRYRTEHPGEAEKSYTHSMSSLMADPTLLSSKELETLTNVGSDYYKKEDNSNANLIADFQKDILGEHSDQLTDSTKKNKQSASSKNSQRAQIPATSSAELDLPRIQPPEQTVTTPDTQTVATAKTESAWQKQSNFKLNATTQSQTNEDPSVVMRGFSHPESNTTLSPAYNILNQSIFNQSHYGKGAEYYQRMIASDINALGPNHPSLANDLTGLAQLYISEEKYSDAEPLLTRALKIYDQAYGSSNLLTINTRTLLARTEFYLGNIDRAADLYRNALSQGQAALGPNSIETARILNELAYLYFHQGRLQEAGTFYGWALASTEGAVGTKDPLYAACLKDYAQVLRSLGRDSDATLAEAKAAQILADAKQ